MTFAAGSPARLPDKRGDICVRQGIFPCRTHCIGKPVSPRAVLRRGRSDASMPFRTARKRFRRSAAGCQT
ncbi:MAG TPA: hypothetical protein DCG00_02810 [Alistipes sp.]|nr:hypothetical protein [Alistipes sp.]